MNKDYCNENREKRLTATSHFQQKERAIPFELFLDFARHILAIKVPLMQKYVGYKHSIFVDKNNNNNNNKRKVILDWIASD